MGDGTRPEGDATMQVIGDEGDARPQSDSVFDPMRRPGFEQFMSVQMLRRSPDAVICTDSHSTIIFWSPGAERLFGFTPEQAVGRHVSIIIAEHLQDEQAEQLVAARQSGVFDLDSQTVEAVGRCSDGREIPIETSFCVWTDNGMTIIGAIMRDISERKRIQAELASSRDDAQAANRAKSEFLTNISHEIRTPLNGIVGLAELLAGAELTDRHREMIELIRSSGETLARLLTDVVDLARVEGGQLELHREPLDLAGMVRSVVGLSMPSADAKGLRVDIDIDPAANCTVLGDELRLRQILSNLVNNAVKFTNAGMVKVSVRKLIADVGERYRIEVRDTGVGISADHKSRIFDRFVQGDGSVTRRFSGAGLGLTLSRQMADIMGATLSCRSRPGRGSIFSLTVDMPAASNPSPTLPSPYAAQAGPGDGAPIRVLVVDDNPTNRRVIELILQQTGMLLTMAEDGLQAVEAFKATRFDMVLMDIQMPVMDGLTATSAIRDFEQVMQLPRTPLIVVSANALTEHIEASARAGADLHLAKPLTAAALIGAMQRALAGGEDDASAGRPVLRSVAA